MVNVNGKAKLTEDEQLIVKQAWILEMAQKMNILITESSIEDHYLYIKTANGNLDLEAFKALKGKEPYIHFGYSVNGISIQ